MKKLFLISAVAISLAGCATKYDVTLTSGTHITSKGMPKLINDSYYRFTDAMGQKQTIPAFKVRSIAPQDRWANDPKKDFFNAK